LVEEITKNIKKVKGEFRQEEVSKLWEDFGIVNKDKEVLKVRIKVNCSSGTYIRRIANDLGNELGVPAFAYSIKRVSIGDINESSCLKFI
jgi:tRNA U55 pseudouridine synthase TruB